VSSAGSIGLSLQKWTSSVAYSYFWCSSLLLSYFWCSSLLTLKKNLLRNTSKQVRLREEEMVLASPNCISSVEWTEPDDNICTERSTTDIAHSKRAMLHSNFLTILLVSS